MILKFFNLKQCFGLFCAFNILLPIKNRRSLIDYCFQVNVNLLHCRRFTWGILSALTIFLILSLEIGEELAAQKIYLIK